jgi:hypothetical protein
MLIFLIRGVGMGAGGGDAPATPVPMLPLTGAGQ